MSNTSTQLELELVRVSLTPDYKPHNDLEADVKAYAASLGFKTSEATYHTVMPPDVVKILQYRFTPAALYIRSRADRLAINHLKPIEFEWEAKTHKSATLHDMTIELLPIVFHLAKLRVGIDCLYCYRNPYNKANKGFWISEMPSIRVIMFPQRREWLPLKDWIKSLVDQFLGGMKIVPITWNRFGSGDPFIIIDHKTVENLDSWQELIQCKVDLASNGR